MDSFFSFSSLFFRLLLYSLLLSCPVFSSLLISSLLLSIVSYDRPIRVTSRADQAANPLESVQCRPVHVVREAAHQHLEVLKKAGYETKFFTYQEGTLYRWGKAVITVSRLYLPESTKMADCKKNPVTDDWLVEVTMLTTSDAAEDAARTLLHIQNVLSERIALVK